MGVADRRNSLTLRFLTSYRSRAWGRRFAAGEVVALEPSPLLDDCLTAGVAEVVIAAGEAAPQEPSAVSVTADTAAPERAPEPEEAA